jgi:hypothetical protein
MSRKPTAWTDLAHKFCQCNAEDCNNIHSVDELPARYTLRDADGEFLGESATMDNFLIDLRDQNADNPFVPGEATVRDLAARVEMDAAEFLATR